MRLSRLIATASVVLGVGLISGAVTQVAALDGSLERAAGESRTPPPYLRVDDHSRPDIPRCGHPDRHFVPNRPVAESESEST
jgi:hypothetical protein